jgi:hypothetical protein
MSALWEIPRDGREHVVTRRELTKRIHVMLGQLQLWVAASKNLTDIDIDIDMEPNFVETDGETDAGLDVIGELDGPIIEFDKDEDDDELDNGEDDMPCGYRNSYRDPYRNYEDETDGDEGEESGGPAF